MLLETECSYFLRSLSWWSFYKANYWESETMLQTPHTICCNIIFYYDVVWRMNSNMVSYGRLWLNACFIKLLFVYTSNKKFQCYNQCVKCRELYALLRKSYTLYDTPSLIDLFSLEKFHFPTLEMKQKQ